MKLIIDVSKETYKRCCVIADLDGSPILKAIKDGIPLDEIRAELMLIEGMEDAIEIIDKYRERSE